MEIAEALKRLVKDIQNKELINSNDKLILGCSAGADSTAMLYLFSKLRHKLNVSLLAVHVNHQLRGSASDADEAAIKDLCLKLNVPLIIRRIVVPNSGNLENQARKMRFAAFEQVQEIYCFDKILLAHHSDDQAETVILNIIRGSGLNGLSGIKPISGKILHPMLCFSHQELVNLLEKAGISWQTDSSNLDNSFSRNRLRNDLLPKLSQEYNPAIKKHLNQLADILLQADNLLLNRSRLQLKRVTLDSSTGRIVLDNLALLKLSPVERYYIIRLSIRKLLGSETDFLLSHFQAIEDILPTGGSKQLFLPHGVMVKKIYDDLVIYTSEESAAVENTSIEIDADRSRAVLGNYRFSFKHLRILPKDMSVEDGKLRVIIDSDKIKIPFTIRFRKPGDRFIPFGHSGLKRLKEFFIDEKVPKYDRDLLPIFDDGEKLFWIVGYRIDNRVRRDENSQRYLMIEAEPINARLNRAARKKEKRGNDESNEL